MDFQFMVRTYESFQKVVLNIEFFKNPTYRTNLFKDAMYGFSLINSKIQENAPDMLRIYDLPNKDAFIPDEYNSIIIDMEGDDPIVLVGLLVHNTIYSYVLPDYNDIPSFYEHIISIFRVFQDSLVFGFTFWDYDHLFLMRDVLVNTFHYDPTKYHFLSTLKYFNLQSRERESIPEALYSLGEHLPKDPLYRRMYHITDLYEDGFYEIIREHNVSCLRAALILLTKRYLPTKLLTPIPNLNSQLTSGGSFK